MSCKYSIELREFVEDPLFTLFDFEYPFYTDDLKAKEEFEDKFIEHYYFHEIGFETVARFKHQLRAKLREIMPYYKQIHESELATKGINFLLNKDLREEFIREASSNSASNASSESSTNLNTTTQNDSKVSNIDNGVAAVNLSSGNLTGVSQDKATNKGTNNSKTGSSQSNENNQSEKTVLISQGNIGTTSSGDLLLSWRKSMINIQAMLIEECHDLFMLVY